MGCLGRAVQCPDRIALWKAQMPQNIYKLYETSASGNCYKVRLILNQLDIAYERIPTDILKGESRTPEYLAMNPNGRTPLLILPDGTALAESNAILYYLAELSASAPANDVAAILFPKDLLGKAESIQWLFFEQNSHEPFIATNRFFLHILKDPVQFEAQIRQNQAKGYAALDVMDKQLAHQPFFGGATYGIADIALYAYTHVAHEGGYDLAAYTHIAGWMARVQGQPRHTAIDG